MVNADAPLVSMAFPLFSNVTNPNTSVGSSTDNELSLPLDRASSSLLCWDCKHPHFSQIEVVRSSRVGRLIDSGSARKLLDFFKSEDPETRTKIVKSI